MLLDTDIGNDIDDAVCLAYLLAQPRCELLGITTVTAAPDLRAGLASVLCRNAGRDVPIYPGAADPLVGPPVQEPERRGFGSRFIEGSVAAELQGTAKLAFERSGLVCTMEIPFDAAKLAAEDDKASDR